MRGWDEKMVGRRDTARAEKEEIYHEARRHGGRKKRLPTDSELKKDNSLQRAWLARVENPCHK
jgi:hypothetical protein